MKEKKKSRLRCWGFSVLGAIVHQSLSEPKRKPQALDLTISQTLLFQAGEVIR